MVLYIYKHKGGKYTMRVAIATDSAEKIKGIKSAFSRFFKSEEDEIEFFHQKVDSGVPEQPFNEETYKGALNRVNTLIEKSKKADFYISCEAGIEEFFGKYLNVQIICLFDSKKQRYLWGKSSGWQIPYEDIEIIRNSNLDDYLRSKGINCAEDLLGANYSRAEAIAQATEFALASQKLL